jgi:V/A-type H+-transporting ATPase subunit I
VSLRSVPTRWFELLTPHNELTSVLDALSRTGAVELATYSRPGAQSRLPDLRDRLDEFDALAQRYQVFWPRPLGEVSLQRESPVALIDRALARLRAWGADADGLIARRQMGEQERGALTHLHRVLAGAEGPLPDLTLLSATGPYLKGQLYFLGQADWPEQIPSLVIVRRIVADDGRYLLFVGPEAQVAALEDELRGLKAQRIALPAWLPAAREAAADKAAARLAEVEAELGDIDGALARLNEAHALAEALGIVAVVGWFASHAESLPATDYFVWVTGWTDDVDGSRLDTALQSRGVRYVLHFPESPEGMDPPMVLRNPPWARPFELFARLMGTPARNEVDPSRILAVLAPLLFGFMFADVGQGVVLVVAGLVLGRRMPVLRLLVSGGAVSIVFGFLFGSLLGREDIIPALWLHPLEEPVTLLLVTLIGGAAILTSGLALDALQAAWRGQGFLWLTTRGGLAAAYLAILAALLDARALWVAALCVVWAFAGLIVEARARTPGAISKVLGEIFESLAQLAINTLSFARVGAFALAHAGLSAAIVGVSDALGSPVGGVIVMALGNALVIVLEGLVVAVQTTRLVMFEFFIRFLRAQGREFRPLAAPSPHVTRPEWSAT